MPKVYSRRTALISAAIVSQAITPSTTAQCELWLPFGTGIPFSDLNALVVHNNQLIAGGGFGNLGNEFQNIAKFDINGSWVQIGGGLNNQVRCFLNYGNDLIVGGFFTASGNGAQQVKRLARWNGTTWETYLGGVDNFSVETMIEFNGDLIVAGSFTGIAGLGINRIGRWNGSNWSQVGTGIQSGTVYALAEYQGTLIAGGVMSLYTGENGNIVYWTGTTWVPFAGGVTGDMSASGGGVNALLVHEGKLYMGGCFTHAGGVQVNGLARLNGQLWEPVSNGFNHCVNSLTVHNGQLIAGGAFEMAGGVPCSKIAKLTPSGWSPVGVGLSGSVLDMYNNNEELLACGGFSSSGGTQLNAIAHFGCVNDTCQTAILKGAGSHPFTTVGAVSDNSNEPQCNGDKGPIQRDVWYRYLAQCTGTATVSLCGASFDTKLAVYATCPNPSDLALTCNEDYCGSSSQVIFPVVAGALYRIRIGSATGVTGTGTMVITCIPAPPCPADINHDSTVNVGDMLAVINTWGACQAPCPTDLNSDGTVNVSDLLVVINAWGACP